MSEHDKNDAVLAQRMAGLEESVAAVNNKLDLLIGHLIGDALTSENAASS